MKSFRLQFDTMQGRASSNKREMFVIWVALSGQMRKYKYIRVARCVMTFMEVQIEWIKWCYENRVSRDDTVVENNTYAH